MVYTKFEIDIKFPFNKNANKYESPKKQQLANAFFLINYDVLIEIDGCMFFVAVYY